MTKVLGLVSVCLLAVGLFLGFSPLHDDGWACGSAFHPRNDWTAIMLGAPSGVCQDQRDSRSTQAWVAIIAGVILGAGAVVTRKRV